MQTPQKYSNISKKTHKGNLKYYRRIIVVRSVTSV